MNITKLIIQANELTDLCKKYGIEWKLNLAGITIYRCDTDDGTWFPLADCQKALHLIMEIANISNTSQETLDKWIKK